MLPGDGSAFTAVLTTRGRVTGRGHSKTLRAVMHDGRIYFSRRRPDSDWFRNAAANPEVEVRIGREARRGSARVVEDQALLRRISELKYPGQERAAEGRVAVEVTLRGP